MKKLVMPAVVTTGLLLSSLCFASAAPVMQTGSNFTGFFAGMDFGFRNVNAKIQHTRSGMFSIRGDVSNNITQSTEGLHLGYGYQFDNDLYLGLKAFAFIAQGRENAETSFAYGDFGHHLTFGTLYGLNAQLGYAVTPRFMPYLTAGYEALNVQDSIKSDDGIEHLNINKYVSGADVGVGANFKVADHWLLNAEFTGAYFGNANKTSGNNTVKVTPYVYTGTVGVSYLF